MFHFNKQLDLADIRFYVILFFQYSLEGHQFAVFGFCLTSDLRYIVSISNKFITWDLSTSDLTRDVNPGIEGIMQQLVLSPDNRFVAAYTNNNQTVLLNTLTSEYIIMENPLPQHQPISGVFLLNTHLFVFGPASWCRQVLLTHKNKVQSIIVFCPRAGLSLQTHHSPLYPLLSLPFRIYISSIYHNVFYHMISSSASNFLPVYHSF